jgi:flagellar biosynthesis/type III secretory pathway chaperone
MMEDRLILTRIELEQALVQQFKLLKDLITLTKWERSRLLNDPDAVITIVEEKEAMLDKLTLLEDQCRETVQELSLYLDAHSPETSIQALLPFFDPEDAKRIKSLSEGISSLACQARELSRANQAIALTKLDWLKATQSFLISIFLPEAGYQKPGEFIRRDAAGLGVEFRV